MATLLTI